MHAHVLFFALGSTFRVFLVHGRWVVGVAHGSPQRVERVHEVKTLIPPR